MELQLRFENVGWNVVLFSQFHSTIGNYLLLCGEGSQCYMLRKLWDLAFFIYGVLAVMEIVGFEIFF